MLTKSNKLKTLGVFSSYTELTLSRYSFAKIHSVFPNGFNLNFNGELVFVSYHQKDRLSARGFTIDQSVYNKLHPYLEVGLQVRFKENIIRFYTRPKLFTIEITEKEIKTLKLDSINVKDLKKVHFKKNLEELDPFKFSGFSKNDFLLQLLIEIKEDKALDIDHIKKLVGSGIGLTPSGDDFLQGFLLMEQTIGHSTKLQESVKEILENRSTTDVSISYYEALFDGYYNEDWVRLFEAINENDERLVKEYLSLIKKYGETSGYDILLGILTYLQIIKE